MKKVFFLTALGVLLPSVIFAQQCQWVCDDGAGGSVQDYSAQLRLSEFLPNPEEDDTAGEFIEIENLTAKTLDLVGWQLTDASGRKFTFKEGIIASRAYLAIMRTTSKIALNNTEGESVAIISPDEKIQDEIEFEGSAQEGASYARSQSGWAWTLTPTPNKANTIQVPNEPPVLEVEIPKTIFAHQEATFSAGESADDDGDTLHATWTFTDGTILEGLTVSHVFESSGDYSVRVTVADTKEGSDSDEFDFLVNPYDLSDAVFMNELYPKPDTGQEEFIELVNKGDVPVELGGWQLTDGTRTFTFSADATCNENGFLAIYKSESGIALNDTGDSVQLIRPDESVADLQTYASAQKAKSYSRYDVGWLWMTPTPAEPNEVQDEGAVLGAMSEFVPAVSSGSLEVSQSFFDQYGIYIIGALVAGGVSVGLYKKWKRDKEEREEYDIV